MNEEHYRVAEEYIFQVLQQDLSVDSMEESQWAALLINLQDMAQTFVSDISDALSLIICSSDEHKKNRSITLWIEAIARTYQRNPEYLLHTMSALYQWYLDNNGEPTSGNPNAPLRKQTLNWLSDCFGASGKDWYHRWLPKKDDELQNSSLYQILLDCPHQWATWNGLQESDCQEPPLPGGIFFRILAADVDRFAANPSAEFDLHT